MELLKGLDSSIASKSYYAGKFSFPVTKCQADPDTDWREPLSATRQFECGFNRDSILIFKLALLFCKAPGHVKSKIYQSLKYLNSAAVINKTSNWNSLQKVVSVCPVSTQPSHAPQPSLPLNISCTSTALC